MLDSVQLNYNQDNILVVNIILAFIMFGVALNLTISNFLAVFKQGKPVLIGLFSQFVLLPFLTFLLILLFQTLPSIALGMIMVAACPGGNISNLISNLAR